MTKQIKRAIAAGALVFSMVAGILSPAGAVLTSADAGEQVTGDEGAEGLIEIDKLTVSSPDEKIKVKIWKDAEGTYYYSSYLNGHIAMKCAKFGIVTKNDDLSTGLELDEASIKTTSGTNDYDLLQGPVNHVKNEYNQLSFTLKKGNADVTMDFRVLNEGMAYRYNIDSDRTSENEELSITSEESYFRFPETSTYWTTDESRTYEAGRYTERTNAQMVSMNGSFSTPALCYTGADGNNAWVLISEASVYNNDTPYCASVFQSSSRTNQIKVRFGGSLDGEQDLNNHGAQMPRRHTQIKKVDFTNKVTTPWRAAIIGENLESIISSTLIPDLNPEPSDEYDFSWVKPGTSVWSWWSTGSDAVDYDSMFDYIDFCSAAGITYCLVDYGWEIWPDYETKVAKLVDYADERNVGILLWYGVHKWDNKHIFDLDNYDDIEEQMAWCERMGVKGVKVDYIESDSQFAMWNMYQILESAARHKQVVNFHGATDPNGENRTFPNLLSSEAVCGMEYFKWSDASAPETLVTLPFTRNVIGSMEYTPALMRIENSPATSGFMLSMCINYESAVSTFAQSGYVYPGYAAFPLIADVPSTWDETRLLDGYPYKYNIMAKRSGENWYIGAMSVPKNNYEVGLDFLDEGETYYAYIYRDNAEGDGIEVETRTVTSYDALSFDLLENGGAAVKLTKNDPVKWTEYDNFNFYEAEKATLSGRASVVAGKNFVSGRAWVEGLGSGSGNSVTFNVNAEEEGDYQLKVYIIAANNRNLTIDVNNGDDKFTLQNIIGIAGDGNAVGATKGYQSIYLKKGKNTVSLYTESGGAPAIDRIAVSKTLIDGAEVKLSQNEYEYNGEECRPQVTVTRNGVTLTEGKEYNVFYSNCKYPGTAKVYITGANGYGGQLVEEYTIKAPATPAPTPSEAPKASSTPSQPIVTPAAVKAPKAPKLRSVKSKAKRTVIVKFKKVNGVSGYQLKYAYNKKFKKAKTIKIKAKKVSVIIKRLKSKKPVYVKLRAYKLDGNKKVYSKWSNVKSVKKVK